MTSSTAPKLVWRSERIDGIATLTIGTSRIAMNAPTSTTARTSQSPPSDRAPRRTAAKIQRGSARPGWRRPPPRVARLRHADAGPPRQPRALPRLPHARDRRPRANGLRREPGQLPPPAQQRPVADADRAGGRAHARRRAGAARRAAEGPRPARRAAGRDERRAGPRALRRADGRAAGVHEPHVPHAVAAGELPLPAALGRRAR